MGGLTTRPDFTERRKPYDDRLHACRFRCGVRSRLVLPPRYNPAARRKGKIYQTRGLNFMAGAPKPNPLEQGDLHGIIADLFRTFRARLEELVPASVHRQMAIDHMSEAERNSHAAVPK
jgi:hypothetical protein